MHSNGQVAVSTTRFHSGRPPLLDTKFENFLSSSGATKSCISTGGLGCMWGKFSQHFPLLQPKSPDSYLTKTWGTSNWQNSKRYLQFEAFTKVRGITKYGTLTLFLYLHIWAACVQLAYIMQIMCQTYKRNFGIYMMPLKSIQLKTPRLNEYSSLYMNREMYSVIHEIVHFVFSSKPQNTCF